MFKNEYYSYKQQFQQSQEFIGTLEIQNSQLKDKVGRLNEIATRYNQKTEQAESTLLYANKGTKQAINLLNQDVNEKKSRIYGNKNVQDAGTITILFGTNKDIVDHQEQESEVP